MAGASPKLPTSMSEWLNQVKCVAGSLASWAGTVEGEGLCMGTVLRHVLLLQKDITKAARFYNEGLELPILALTDRWAELGAGSSRIALKAVEGEAYANCGYSPFLSFKVEDLQSKVQKLLELGAVLDGPIQYTDRGKVAAMRGPDGQMLSLFESAA